MDIFIDIAEMEDVDKAGYMEGFTLVEEQHLVLRKLTGKIYRHSCGMEVVSLESDDSENVFCIGFNTVPEDNTGVPHIIEHSVLCGSRHYPVKEPFIEMLKGSLATFINAVTGQEYTLYPIATTVSKDYFNLASVYFDAVFQPLMTREAFMQEGWHLELNRRSKEHAPLKYNGIVLNEMKGDMNDIDTVICREMNNGLYPNTPRRFNSGGAPYEIPSLTYEKYKRFYRRHYHPSQAKVYLYGNIPTEKKLQFLDSQLQALGKLKPVPTESKTRNLRREWKERHSKQISYVPEVSQDMCKGAWARGYHITSTYDTMLDSSFEFLEALLLGNPSAPLSKALTESKLCDNICISGYDDETCESSFLVAVNGVKFQDYGRLEQLVDQVFEERAREGFSQDEIERVVTAYKRRQASSNDSSIFPIMDDVYDGWLLGLHPFKFLHKQENLAVIESKIRQEPDWLPHLIRKYLCENKQVLTLRLKPDATLQKRLESAEQLRLKDLAASMTPVQMREVGRVAKELKAAQARPNSPQALATLPYLRREDFPEEVHPGVKSDLSELSNGGRFLDISMPVNGITYFTFAFPLWGIPCDQLIMYAVFKKMFSSLGTEKMSWDQAAQRWASTGAACEITLSTGRQVEGEYSYTGYLEVSLRVLDGKFKQTLDDFREKWYSTVFTEKSRVETICRANWAALRSVLSNNSYAIAEACARSGLQEMDSLIPHLDALWEIRYQRHLAEAFDKAYEPLVQDMESFSSVLRGLSPVIYSYLGPESNRQVAMEFANSFAKTTFGVDFAPPVMQISAGRRECLGVPANVSGCARVYRSPGYGEEGARELRLFSKLLSEGYLWDELRIKGGAYGVSCLQRSYPGVFSIYTTQDPSPKNTFRVLDTLGSLPWNYSEREVSDSIMATLKGLLKPCRQNRASRRALSDYLYGKSDEYYGRVVSAYLGINNKGLKEAVRGYFASNPLFNDCVVGPEKVVSSLGMSRLTL